MILRGADISRKTGWESRAGNVYKDHYSQLGEAKIHRRVRLVTVREDKAVIRRGDGQSFGKTAVELLEAMNRMADENLPKRLADTVKVHAGIAVGASFIPVTGLDMAAVAANVWTMYVRINKDLDLPFGENILKSIAAGVATNLAGGVAGLLVVASAAKFFPGIGTVAGAALMGGTVYAITITSGVVYMKALTALARRNIPLESISAAELKAATTNVAKDKAGMKKVMEDAKNDFKNAKMPS